MATLPFVGIQLECLPCKNYAAVAWRSRSRKELLDFINASTENRTIYMDGLKAWEEEYVRSEYARIRKGSINALSFNVHVETVNQTQMHFEKELGVFWPVGIWEMHFKAKAHPKKVTQIEEDGKWVSGIILPTSQGNPTGTTRMTKQWFKGARKITELASSHTELREGQVDDMWQVAQKAASSYDTRSELTNAEEGSTETLTLQVRPKAKGRAGKKSKDDSSDEGDCDFGLGQCVRADRAPPGNGNKGAGSRKREATVDIGAAALGGVAADEQVEGNANEATIAKRRRLGGTGAGASASAGARGPATSAAARQNREGMQQFNGIIAAESVVRDARHLLNTAQNHGLLSTMTSATVEVKLKTVKSKSDAGLLALYSSENPGFVFETEEDGGIDADALTARGLELIENLQHVKKCLEAVLELVRGMEATSIGVKRRDPNCASHQYLYSAKQNVLACSLKVPACVDLEIVSRAFTQAFEANDWELCKRLLSTQAAGPLPIA